MSVRALREHFWTNGSLQVNKCMHNILRGLNYSSTNDENLNKKLADLLSPEFGIRSQRRNARVRVQKSRSLLSVKRGVTVSSSPLAVLGLSFRFHLDRFISAERLGREIVARYGKCPCSASAANTAVFADAAFTVIMVKIAHLHEEL